MTEIQAMYGTLELSYPYDDLRTAEAFKKILDRLDRINIKDLEKLTENYV